MVAGRERASACQKALKLGLLKVSLGPESLDVRSVCVIRQLTRECRCLLATYPLANLVAVESKDGEVFFGRVRFLRLFILEIIILAERVVRDFGPGVDPAELPRLAEAFYRPDSARTRAAGGVGLGLHLCRLVAEAHGGTLVLRNAGPGLEVAMRWRPQAA